ncbi:hypothetical protein PSOLE_01950 [Pseudomonas oleovorans subsp. oleovorans]|nr:hypothetical protein PSOLE_01950 [Pseudomonas oleovorans subsp. oleovorans]
MLGKITIQFRPLQQITQTEPLEMRHRAAKGLAFLDVLDGGLQRRLGAGHSATGIGQALLGEHIHQVEEAALGIAQEVLLGHLNVVEEQLGSVLAVHAELLQLLAALEAGHAPLHQKQPHGVLVGRVGLGCDDHYISQVAVGDEHLGTVEQPVIALVHGRGAHAGQIGAGRRLGHRHRQDGFTADDARQQARLLLGIAVLGDIGAAQRRV